MLPIQQLAARMSLVAVRRGQSGPSRTLVLLRHSERCCSPIYTTALQHPALQHPSPYVYQTLRTNKRLHLLWHDCIKLHRWCSTFRCMDGAYNTYVLLISRNKHGWIQFRCTAAQDAIPGIYLSPNVPCSRNMLYGLGLFAGACFLVSQCEHEKCRWDRRAEQPLVCW